MSKVLITQYTEERQSLLEQMDATTEAAVIEERDLTVDESDMLSKAQERIAAIDPIVARLVKTEELRAASVSIDFAQARAAARQKAQFEVTERAPNLSDFIDSEQYRAWASGMSGNTSGRVSIDTRASSLRATLTEGSAPGSALLPANAKYVLPTGASETPLLDVISRLQVSTNAVDLVTYGSPLGATGAATVAEAAKKPEASVTAASTTVNIPTVAYWLKVTRQLLQDAPAARGFLDDQLRRGLLHKMELDAATAIGGATYTKTTGVSKQPAIEVARMGIASVEAAGFRPNAILCSPADAASFDLAIYSKTLGGAAAGINPWGLRVIPVVGLSKIYVGDFATGVTLVERTGVNVYISDSNEDDFLKNVFTILAEYRAATVVTQPAAITELAITP